MEENPVPLLQSRRVTCGHREQMVVLELDGVPDFPLQFEVDAVFFTYSLNCCVDCCMGLNICPFQPQKWLHSGAGWFLSIRGSFEAWRSWSTGHDILSAVADPLGSPPPEVCKAGVGRLCLPMHHAEHRDPDPPSCLNRQRGLAGSPSTQRRRCLWSQLLGEGSPVVSSFGRAVSLGAQCRGPPHP